MNDFGIKKTQELMQERLSDYIKSQYFGDNALLLGTADDLLRQEGGIYQKPFIESTPSYEKIDSGIEKGDITPEAKAFFEKLIENKLGVFRTPFRHQVESLVGFEKNQNLFVATGTGSGKTECFMWPIIDKLFTEAKDRPNSWEKRGIRTLIIYPMNALVSDQIARLRSIIGDPNGKFRDIFVDSTHGRRPQFGMYTGRTPYPGDKIDKKTNHLIAESYRESFLVDPALKPEEQAQKQKDIDGLIQIHKYPSKNMKEFVEALENDHLSQYNNSNDAELLLRSEMQNTTPDILITNYSMLEYMLTRPIEARMFENTKSWLQLDSHNRLLIVIDEAHMYSGASGGEVALLIKRLFSRIGVSQNEVQFILTTASMPFESEEDKTAVKTFAEDLTGCDRDSFLFLTGHKTSLVQNSKIPLDVTKLAGLPLQTEMATDEAINSNIAIFAEKIFGVKDTGPQPAVWLYKNLPSYEPFIKLFSLCKGDAISYHDLLHEVIGQCDSEGALALDNLLAIATLAKDDDGNSLFPARIHSFFRGLNGVFACVNPNCNHGHEGDHVRLGELFTEPNNRCPYCNSKVYELVNDRRCGALYLKGYVEADKINGLSFYFWAKKGLDQDGKFIEYPLYLVPEGFDYAKKPKNTRSGYLDTKSGKVYLDCTDSKTLIPVLMSDERDDDQNATFGACPKCGKEFKMISLTDFRVKGNLPFYSIVKAQFEAQPMRKTPNKFVPNGGKKVLLFSDSRQGAAVLARDMTKVADMDSFRKTLYLAMQKLYSNGIQEFPMSLLYVAFLQVSEENNLRFFYAHSLDTFENDKAVVAKNIKRWKTNGRPVDYYVLSRSVNVPSQMYEADLLELFCSPTINFLKLGLGYIAPVDDAMDECIDALSDIHFEEGEFEKIFLSFLYSTFVDAFAFDNKIPEQTRRLVKYKKGNRYGFSKLTSYYRKSVMAKHPGDYERIYQTITDVVFSKPEGDANYFLNLDKVKIVLDPTGKGWHRCRTCGAILPFEYDGHCLACDSDDVETSDCDRFTQIDYWRKPIFSKDPVKSLNTEEHSAQLSLKDQKVQTWAKTEDYEMRFQDVNVEKEGATPIDILSCTTTMEVGIDIGSLTAIGLRNVPPLRENYQQRAGRAGRRGTSISTVVTYAQGGPHDSYYFAHPEKIIRGKPRRPWIDVHNSKLIARHFDLIVLTKFFLSKNKSLYDCTIAEFKELLPDLLNYLEGFTPSAQDMKFLFLGESLVSLKDEMKKAINDCVASLGTEDEKKDVFSVFFERGFLPTYSFPLDVVDFTIFDSLGNVMLSPQRSLDIAINEYAPGRTIVVDKKTYKSGGFYSPVPFKNSDYYSPAAEYFKPENGYFFNLYMCDNPLCGWFGREKPADGLCPFCGQPITEENTREMIKPWGFAPVNGKDIPESEAISDMTYSGDPCYSATPSGDLSTTKYKNIKIANAEDQEIIVLNKGHDDEGFDVCTKCGAAQPHSDKTLRENLIGAPYYQGGRPAHCDHANVDEGLFIGTSFLTDMFFLQIELDSEKITDNDLILKSASQTLAETLRLSASRILDVEYNDICVGTRLRKSGAKRFADIYFYDSLSSGAGYATQIKDNLSEIFDDAITTLKTPGIRDLCNYWNQRIQYLFNKEIALDLLLWAMDGKLPDPLSEAEISAICTPLLSILGSETSKTVSIHDGALIIDGNRHNIVSGITKCGEEDFSDVDIEYSLPSVVETLIC